MGDEDKITKEELEKVYDLFEDVLKQIKKPDKKTEIRDGLTEIWKDTTRKFLDELDVDTLEDYQKIMVPLITYNWMWTNILIYTNRAQNEVFKSHIDPEKQVQVFHKLFNAMVKKNLKEDMEDLFHFAEVFGDLDGE
ncbi:MAG: hypothetical protein JSW28_00325 [Thermoplasmata archaeon]|nr:MAG: hypothetical protein JSW28_00325 [Thermoplasmata archaeon]